MANIGVSPNGQFWYRLKGTNENDQMSSTGIYPASAPSSTATAAMTQSSLPAAPEIPQSTVATAMIQSKIGAVTLLLTAARATITFGTKARTL